MIVRFDKFLPNAKAGVEVAEEVAPNANGADVLGTAVAPKLKVDGAAAVVAGGAVVVAPKLKSDEGADVVGAAAADPNEKVVGVPDEVAGVEVDPNEKVDGPDEVAGVWMDPKGRVDVLVVVTVDEPNAIGAEVDV